MLHPHFRRDSDGNEDVAPNRTDSKPSLLNLGKTVIQILNEGGLAVHAKIMLLMMYVPAEGKTAQIERRTVECTLIYSNDFRILDFSYAQLKVDMSSTA